MTTAKRNLPDFGPLSTHLGPWRRHMIEGSYFMAFEVSDEQLAKLAQQGDKEAFLSLYNRYLNRVYNRVKSKVPYQDVEDVTQDIFIAVVRSLDSFEQRSRFNTWLYTIVNRQIA